MPGYVIALIIGAFCVLALPVLAILAGMLLPALAKAKEKAQSIKCINNLKNLGLATRIYSTDNENVFPGNWLQVTNEITVPALLCCPADRDHHPALDWNSVRDVNISYTYLGKGITNGEPTRVVAICPVHGHLLMADGSVQQQFPRRPPIPVTRRDGGTWLGR